MPELQHEQGPEPVTVEGRVILLMKAEQLFDGSGSEIAAFEAASGEQGVTSELAKARVVLEPVAGGQAKAMFDLGEDLFREKLPECFLEDVALFRSADFVRGGKRGHEFNQRVIEQRKPHPETGRLGRPDDLEEIIIGQGDLEIDMEKTIELTRARSTLEVPPANTEGPVRHGRALEIRMKQPVAVLIDKELARVEAVRVRERCALDIPPRLAGEAGRVDLEAADRRLDESPSKWSGGSVGSGEGNPAAAT